MSKELKKKFEKFVNAMTEEEVRKELVLAYLQMERCQQVLRGEDVKPVTMRDNGESSDLELFYRCKKCAEELAYLKNMASKSKKDITKLIKNAIKFGELSAQIESKSLQSPIEGISENTASYWDEFKRKFSNNDSDNIKISIKRDNDSISFSHLKNIDSMSISLKALKRIVDGKVYSEDVLLEKKDEDSINDKEIKDSKKVFHPFETVWYCNGQILVSRIVRIEYDVFRSGIRVCLEDGSVFGNFDGLFRTKEELIKNLKKNINGTGE